MKFKKIIILPKNQQYIYYMCDFCSDEGRIESSNKIKDNNIFIRTKKSICPENWIDEDYSSFKDERCFFTLHEKNAKFYRTICGECLKVEKLLNKNLEFIKFIK